MADPYAVRLGVKVTHSEAATSYVYFSTGSYPLIAKDEGGNTVWEAAPVDVSSSGGGTVGENYVSKEFSGEWTVWFNIPQDLVIYAFDGIVVQDPCPVDLEAWLYLYVEWSDLSVTEIGSLGPGGFSWDGQLPLGWLGLEDPIDSTPDVVAELWQRKINTIEVNT